VSLTDEERRLLRVSKSGKRDLKAYKEGVHLEAASSRTIDDLRAQACADRIRLAERIIDDADRAMQARPPMRRAAVGRYYYAMYHAIRAVVFFKTPGDDFEQHSELPAHLPGDFPDVEMWKNELKDARLTRNEADYDPYPEADGDFKDAAVKLKAKAADLISVARSYLHSKGCAHL
jgi:uncharacterized protein (UPF0332 family)